MAFIFSPVASTASISIRAVIKLLRNAGRNAMCLTGISLISAIVGPQLAHSQAYPSSPITIVVPFAAGSGTDAIARTVGQRLSERMGQPVLIDNKPGASAQIGTIFVAKAKPDGYVLLMTTNTSHSANPSLYKTLRYDPIKNFTPIARVADLPFALAVNPSIPATTLKEFIDYAKQHPGKLSYATPNSTSLVASETLKHMAGLDILGVPYKSSPQAMTDLVSNQIQVYVTDLSSGQAMIKAGRVRVLAVTAKQSNRFMPNVPPISKELPGFEVTSWNGIFAPAGLPKAIVDRLNTEILAVLAEPEVQEKLTQISYETHPSKSPIEFARYVEEQMGHWATLISEAGIKPE